MTKCKHCGKEIYLDMEQDWVHKEAWYLDSRACSKNLGGKYAEPEASDD